MALLVSLAALAERAAVRSLPVRFIVLWLLRRAEAVVEEFVFETTGRPPTFGSFASVGNDPADALALAARLSALAEALRALLTPEWLSAARRLDRRGIVFGPVAAGASRPSTSAMRQANDTS